MRRSIQFALVVALILLTPMRAAAHCPLCTVGAGVLAIGAGAIGVQYGVIGVFIGAFSIAISLWINNLLKRQYIKYQAILIASSSFILTIFPLQRILADYTSIYVDYSGSYGSLLNRTYLVDKFIIGAIVGAIVLAVAPNISKYITAIYGGKKILRQNLITTIGLLIIFGIIFQFLS
ncbi:TPA: hypothetical protein DIV45_01025 [Patescibacteria group bacterium]|nr:hypothetical protein [Patescibacteria group bacterium]